MLGRPAVLESPNCCLVWNSHFIWYVCICCQWLFQLVYGSFCDIADFPFCLAFRKKAPIRIQKAFFCISSSQTKWKIVMWLVLFNPWIKNWKVYSQSRFWRPWWILSSASRTWTGTILVNILKRLLEIVKWRNTNGWTGLPNDMVFLCCGMELNSILDYVFPGQIVVYGYHTKKLSTQES